MQFFALLAYQQVKLAKLDYCSETSSFDLDDLHVTEIRLKRRSLSFCAVTLNILQIKSTIFIIIIFHRNGAEPRGLAAPQLSTISPANPGELRSLVSHNTLLLNAADLESNIKLKKKKKNNDFCSGDRAQPTHTHTHTEMLAFRINTAHLKPDQPDQQVKDLRGK